MENKNLLNPRPIYTHFTNYRTFEPKYPAPFLPNLYSSWASLKKRKMVILAT